MKICLVSFPEIESGSIPGDIALLKSFLLDRFPEVQTVACDLSSVFVEWILDTSRARMRDLPRRSDEKADLQRLLEAYEALRSTNGKIATIQDLVGYSDVFFPYAREKLSELDRFLGGILSGRQGEAPEELLYFTSVLEREKPDVVACSCGPLDNLNFMMAVTKHIRERCGCYSVLLTGRFLAKALKEKKWDLHGCYDLVIYGDPYLRMEALIRSLVQGSPPAGEEEATLEEDSPYDPDLLPPADLSDYRLDLYPTRASVLVIHASYGCRWAQCRFCVYSSGNSQLVERNLDRVVEEMAHYRSRYRIRLFSFEDEWIPPDRLAELSEKILDRGLDIRFRCKARLESSYTRAVLQSAYRAGGRYIFWGLESGSQRVLDRMNKGTNLVDIELTLKKSYEAGLLNYCGLVIGLPGETEEDYRRTEQFLLKLREYIYMARPRKLIVIPGMKLYEDCRDAGIRIFKSRPGIGGRTIETPFVYSDGNDFATIEERYRRCVDFCNRRICKNPPLKNGIQNYFAWDPKVWEDAGWGK